MDKFVENFKMTVNKNNKTELSEDEEEDSQQYDDTPCLGLSRLKSYRNLLRFSAVKRNDPKVTSDIFLKPVLDLLTLVFNWENK